ncbi:MAG: redoxin domain-containing protein [Verrucomicrobia bacterium]|jgi:peroxiredoxin|nr:redoxin domain-containing protein [Verrucomicrobiota bacterium]
MEEIRGLDGEVVAISIDAPKDSKKLAIKQGIDFSLLSDPDAQVIDLFGLRHPDANPMGEADIARPATFILDRSGEIVWKIIPDNWRIRIRPETLIEQLTLIE